MKKSLAHRVYLAKSLLVISLGFSQLLFSGLEGLLMAQEEPSESAEEMLVVKTRDGLFFNLPEDWPIEKINGTVGPVPIEKYIAIKFEKMNEKITLLEKRLSALEEIKAAGVKEKPKLISKEIVTDEEI